MKEAERFKALCKIANGKTVCCCAAAHPGCKKPEGCERTTLLRPLFEGWQGTMKRELFLFFSSPCLSFLHSYISRAHKKRLRVFLG